MLMMKNIINIHNVRNGKIVDEESVASSIITGRLNLNDIKNNYINSFNEKTNFINPLKFFIFIKIYILSKKT